MIAQIPNVNVYDARFTKDARYQGCNAETVDCVVPFKLPRTLYHLFFLYFAIHERVQTSQVRDYRIIGMEGKLPMYEPEDIGGIRSRYFERYHSLVAQCRAHLHRDISRFLLKRRIFPHQCQWRNISKIVDEIWSSFFIFNSFPSAIHLGESLTRNFYNYIYVSGKSLHAKNLLKQAIALEWTTDPSKTILYRCSNIKEDDIVRRNGEPHSLSFASSPLSGIVHDITACPLFYQCTSGDLYALKLSDNKLKRYFYDPGHLTDLYSLVGWGEFSHQRLRHYPSSHKNLYGIEARDMEIGKKYAAFDFNQKRSIRSFEAYREKIRSIFHKYLVDLRSFQLPKAKL